MATMEDNVLIAKEELSRKELFLKDRLYKQPILPYSKGTQEMLKGREKTSKEEVPIYNDKPVMKFPVPDPVNSSQILYQNFKSD